MLKVCYLKGRVIIQFNLVVTPVRVGKVVDGGVKWREEEK
jgi:hypothetical protein